MESSVDYPAIVFFAGGNWNYGNMTGFESGIGLVLTLWGFGLLALSIYTLAHRAAARPCVVVTSRDPHTSSKRALTEKPAGEWRR